jgi:hypothetical protein
MDVIGILYVSSGSGTVQRYDTVYSRHECTCSEAGLSSQMVTELEEYVYYQRAVFSCAFFFVGKRTHCKEWS